MSSPDSAKPLLTKEEVEAALLAEARKGSGELPAVVVEAIVEAQIPEPRETSVRCPACECCTLCRGEMMVPFKTAQEWALRNNPVGQRRQPK